MPKELNDISSFIHQAALDPHLDLESLHYICDACTHLNFSGLCTNLVRLPAAKKRLCKNKKTKLIAVIAFPFGHIPSTIKQAEAEWAAENGADELDVVPNFFQLYEGNIEAFAEELAEIASIGLPSRVILDTLKIPKDKLPLAVEACIDTGINGIQTGSGFGPRPSHSHILELSSLTKNRCSIKAVGGIKTLNDAIELINAGVSNIGTSMGIEIAREFQSNSINK